MLDYILYTHICTLENDVFTFVELELQNNFSLLRKRWSETAHTVGLS